MKKIVFLFLLFPLWSLSANKTNTEARITLKKWGMAYCLGTYQKTDTANEAGGARGGYFQLGEHVEPAYKNIKAYFDRVIPHDKRVMQQTGQPNYLIHCLDAYESAEYQTLIQQQDQWIGAEMDPDFQ
jgi:hypothetical protein